MRYLYISILIFVSSLVIGQGKVSGEIVNKQNEPLVGSTVVVLSHADSMMMEFALANEKGQFEISGLELDSFILQVSFIGHDMRNIDFVLSEHELSIDLGTVIINEASEVLQEVTIEAERIPMGIRGDTLTYNAAAFKTKPNATVEDLLKKLPGIEVDRSGNLKAQGKDVENVLVDGKEFFGSDHKMATKNLEAEAVDKVEVYDKASEMEEFTGIDDGNEEKTINLKLKEDYKSGGFGTVDVAGATKERYSGHLNYFRFSPIWQISFLGATNNLNRETFTIQDRIDFMGGIGGFLSSGGVTLSQYGGISDGLNTSTSIGANANFNNGGKFKFTNHFVQTRYKNDLEMQSESQNFSTINDFEQLDTLFSTRETVSNNLNSKLTYKHSPFFNATLKNNIEWNTGELSRLRNSFLGASNFVNGNAFTNNQSSSSNTNFSSALGLKFKFNTKGRNLNSNIKYSSRNADSVEDVINQNQVGLNNISIDQRQDFISDLKEVEFTNTYTEPLSKVYFLDFKYNHGISTETPLRSFFDNTTAGVVFNDELSTHFEKSYNYQRVGFYLRRNVKKLKVKLGLHRQWTNLKGIVFNDEIEINNQFDNYLPQLQIKYNMNGGQDIEMNYNTMILSPDIEQLLPIVDNSNANSTYIGNPNLVPEYRHSTFISYNLFDNFSFTNFWLRLSADISKNRIVNQVTIDDNLFRTTSPVNTNKFRQINLNASFSRPLKPLKIDYRLRSNVSLARYVSFLNGEESEVIDNFYNVRVAFNNRKTKVVNVESGISLDFTTRNYLINEEFNQKFFNINYFLEGEIYLPWKITLSTNFNYRSFSNEDFVDSPDYKLLSLAISKLFMNDKLDIRFSVFDVFKENLGYRRSGGANFLRQDFYNNLDQYFLVGLKYKIGRGKKKNGIQIDFD